MLNTIRVYRYKRALTQEQIARIIGVRTATINTIENGKTVPNLRVAMRLARFFKVPVDQLFIWEGEDEVRPDEIEPDEVGTDGNELVKEPVIIELIPPKNIY